MQRVSWSKSFSDDELVEVLGIAAGQLSVSGFVQVAAPLAIERELVAGVLELLPEKRKVILEHSPALSGVEEGMVEAFYYDFSSRGDNRNHLQDAFRVLRSSRPDVLIVRDDGQSATSQEVSDYASFSATLFLTQRERLLAPNSLNGITYVYEPPLPKVGPIGPRSRPSPLS